MIQRFFTSFQSFRMTLGKRIHWEILELVQSDIKQAVQSDSRRVRHFRVSPTLRSAPTDFANFHHAFTASPKHRKATRRKRSADLVIPINTELIPLPPYRPKLNPAEYIWKHLREKYFYNRHHETMQQLEDNLTDALKETEQNKGLVQKLPGFRWILEPINFAS